MLAPKLEVVDGSNSNSAIYKSIRRFSQEGLNDLIRVLMDSVDDALFELSDKVDNDRERNRYFEAMREIRLKREGLKMSFDLEMQRCFDEFVKGHDELDEFDDGEELTLVELDELEDSIAIDNMIKRARPHFEDDLFAVTERLKAVLRRKEISEEDNPLDPKAICDSFHNASDVLETEIEVKLIFYKLFERYVMNNLGHFYREVNELFVKKGVLPDFRAEQERMKQTSRFMANRIKQSGAPGSPSLNSSQVQLPNANPAAPGGAMMSGDPAAGGLFTTLQQAVAQPGGNVEMFEPMGGVVPAGGVTGFVTALNQLQTSAQPSQPLASIDPQQFRSSAQQQLVAFKQENQHQVSNAENQTIDVVSMLFDFFFDDAALPAPIKVLIGRLQIPILKVAIIDKDFFNHKKHPARKLLDSISRASLGWANNHETEQPLIDKTEEIVNFLIEEFDEDISVFEKALADFEQFLEKDEARFEEANEALRQREAEKDQHIQQSQKAVADLIKQITRSRELSFEVIDFLETTWSSVLFNAHLSLGEESNHWKNLKRISGTFVWSLIPKHSEADRVKIIKTIPALLRALSKGMDLVKINNDVQNRIFKILAQEHAKIVKQTAKNIVTRVDDKTIWPDEEQTAEAFARASALEEAFLTTAKPENFEVVEHDNEAECIDVISAVSTEEVIEDLDQFSTGVKQGKITVDEEIVLDSEEEENFDLENQNDDFYEQALTMAVGSWVEFHETDANALVARLSWKSNVTGNLVFVNRQGHKVRNLTVNALAIELRAGRVRTIESSSVFDRAIYTIMSKMKH